jgi:MFS family permease
MGILADKKFGEKEFLIAALFIMGVSTLAIYFIASTSIFIWSLVLFISRIGAALVEILRDSYFFKKIDAHDVDLIDFFRTTSSLSYIISAALAAILLLMFSIKAIFILVGVVSLLALYPAFRLVDNKCEKEMLAEKS